MTEILPKFWHRVLRLTPFENHPKQKSGIILKSLSEESAGKTIVLVSHRKSTMSLADKTYEMANGRFS